MMLTCQQLTDLVTDYLEGRLSLWQRLKFELHVGMCPHCRRFLKQMRQTREVLGHLPPVELPPDLEAELMERFEGWTAQPDVSSESDPEPDAL